MVCAFRPASFATSRKLIPSGEFSGSAAQANGVEMSEKTFSNERTSAERLRDFRNPRRDENKLSRTFPGKRVLHSGRFFYRQGGKRLQVMMRSRGRHDRFLAPRSSFD